MHTLLDACDQVELPNTALELPGAQSHEHDEKQERERARYHKEQRRTSTRLVREIDSGPTARDLAVSARTVGGHHGMLCMFIIESGIIL
jgi:hypothetical protein